MVKEMILPYNRNMVKACLLFVEADIDIGNFAKIYFAGIGIIILTHRLLAKRATYANASAPRPRNKERASRSGGSNV